jgi:cytochrome c-type biogenesis protein CcmE
VDLTPASTAPAPPRRRNRAAYVVLAVVVVAIGVVVYQALSSASLYFYNVDEAVEQRDELGSDRIRMQGVVAGDPEDTADGIEFTVAFDGRSARVHHDGDPPELFEPGIPVVLEGRWADASAGDPLFASDRILVKHSEEYEAENEDRLDDARDGSSGAGDADADQP